MPTNTYVALDRVTVGTATSTITFTSIPSGYTDLVAVLAYRTTNNDYISMRVNNLSSSVYSFTQLYGTGSTAGSARVSSQTEATFEATPTAPGINNAIIHFQNYSNTTTNKSYLLRSNDSAATVRAIVGLVQTTNAINRLDFYVAGTFASGTTVSLYGIAATTAQGAKAEGGIVTSDANYWYHTFRATDTFRPLQSLTCDYLVVAGGGAGGGGNGAGGGAGGFRTSIGGSTLSVTAQAYTITVGAGGTGTSANGNSGSNSTFDTITSTGGGGGARDGNGVAGGSGGGGGYTSGTGGAGTSGQGNAGGTGGAGGTGSNFSGGGGGGAGAVGGNGGLAIGGLGGAGLSSVFATPTGTGVSTFYAGGGGGSTASGGTVGTGGSGGGGAGNLRDGSSPIAGTANTGGGGGGNGTVGGVGASGGSGIVIVRYAK